jgi:hypothetical protein
MDEHEHDGFDGRRESVRIATGILMGRYGLTGEVAESELMDWSRVTGISVYELAGLLMRDASHRRGTAPT